MPPNAKAAEPPPAMPLAAPVVDAEPEPDEEGEVRALQRQRQAAAVV